MTQVAERSYKMRVMFFCHCSDGMVDEGDEKNTEPQQTTKAKTLKEVPHPLEVFTSARAGAVFFSILCPI